MSELRRIFRFLAPYLRPYTRREVTGLFFGVLFGTFNGLILGVLNVFVGRMKAGTPPLQPPEVDTTGFLGTIKVEAIHYVIAPLCDAANHWLPQMGTPLNRAQVAVALLIFPVLAAVRGIFSYLSSYSISWVGENVTNDLRIAVFRKLSTLSLDYYDKSKTGDMMIRVQGDTAAIQLALDRGVADSVKEPFTILAVLTGLLLIDWKLTLIALVAIPLCVIPVRILGRKVRRASEAGVQQAVSQSSLLIESLGAIRVVKAFVLERVQIDRFVNFSQRIRQLNMKRVQARQMVNPLIEVISMFGIGFVLYYILSGGIEVGKVAAILFGLIAFQTSFKKLASLHVIVRDVGVAIGRLEEVLHLEPTVRERPDPLPLPPFRDGFALRGVRFGYGDQEIVRGIDLRIGRGERIGIAGESGCGKSTLLNLLLRFYDPTGGTISLDGVDLRDAALSDLRTRIALVSQEAVLFDMTVAENIACGRPGATRADVEEAAQAAYAHDFILGLSQGYETPIGERGVRLSGGQRSRLAIARAFIRNAPILILDEPTAALDAASEREVQKALDRLSEHRTVVCVAHRLATLQTTDRIIVLAKGQIVEEGSFATLLTQEDSLFRQMAARQGIRSVEAKASRASA